MEACTDNSKDESPDSNLDFGSIYSDTEDELQNVESNYCLSDLNTSDCDSTDLDSDIEYSHHPTTWKDLKPSLASQTIPQPTVIGSTQMTVGWGMVWLVRLFKA
uniref:Uncharacterized protein n=1 Tax=Amphimedon queenslandica TaxID=400682 RepID=A0A1X7UFI2_AMPQE